MINKLNINEKIMKLPKMLKFRSSSRSKIRPYSRLSSNDPNKIKPTLPRKFIQKAENDEN